MLAEGTVQVKASTSVVAGLPDNGQELTAEATAVHRRLVS
jgi:hypothetical protein